MGYRSSSQIITVGNAAAYTADAQLAEDALKMDEVVVTGTSAGTTKRQLGSYVSTVKADELNKGATGNVLAALQGKTAGAQIIQNSGDPAGGISVRLRGISSINSSSEPLYIVDGVIVNNATTRVTNTQGGYDGTNFVGTIGQNRLADINPADIERVEVLNGAAAAAIYGSRANAGVVQIFTKRGSSGAPVVSFSTNFLINQLRKKVEVNQSPVKFGGPTDGPGAQTQDILTPALTNTTPVTRYDYNDYIFRTGIGTDNNVSVAGGRDKTKYYTSASYYKNQGIIKNTDFRRFSFRINLDQELSSKLSFSTGLNFINSFSNEKPDGNQFFSPLNSINIIGNFHNIRARDALGNLQAVGERGRVNPVSIIEDIKQREETNRLIANAGLKLRLFKGFTIDYTLGMDEYAQKGETFIPPFAYNVSDGFFGGGPTLDPTRNGYASAANYNFFQINNDVSANYQARIGADITSTSQAGYSLQYEKSSYNLQQGRGLAPFVQTVNGASTLIQADGSDGRSELSISGFYAQQTFGYKRLAYLTGAVRVDGSSVFGENQRNQTYANAISASFISNVPAGIDITNTLYALKARYSLAAGLYAQALTAANLVDLTKKSTFNFDALSLNPLYEVATSTNNVVQPKDSTLGLLPPLQPAANDGRVPFYTSINATIAPRFRINGFGATATTAFPVYLPGEITLIKAECYARQATPDLINGLLELNKVVTKTNDPFGVNAGLPPVVVTTQADLLDQIYRNRCIELFMSGLKLEDMRRFGRPTSERKRNLLPYPLRERDNNPNTPADPLF